MNNSVRSFYGLIINKFISFTLQFRLSIIRFCSALIKIIVFNSSFCVCIIQKCVPYTLWHVSRMCTCNFTWNILLLYTFKCEMHNVCIVMYTWRLISKPTSVLVSSLQSYTDIQTHYKKKTKPTKKLDIFPAVK